MFVGVREKQKGKERKGRKGEAWLEGSTGKVAEGKGRGQFI